MKNEQLPNPEEEEQSEEQQLGGDTCEGVLRPAPENPNGHYECENGGWVWYDDIG